RASTSTTRWHGCDSQLGDAKVADIRNYIQRGKLWDAFVADAAPVLLIDETRETVVAKQRPIVVITSNNEKELPDAFLRRCFFHYIRFPDRDTMTEIV